MLIFTSHNLNHCFESRGTRSFWNVFEAVQKTRSTCFIGSKTTRLRLIMGLKCGQTSRPKNICFCPHINPIMLWALSHILVIRNNLYSSIRCSVQRNDYLLLTDPDMVSIFDKMYSLQYSVLMPLVNKQQL